MIRRDFSIKRKQKFRELSAGIIIPKINICGVYKLDRALDKYKPDFLVSICGNPDERETADHIISLYKPITYRMYFDDIHFEDIRDQSIITEDKRILTPDMIREVFDFIDLNFSDSFPKKILAQCTMGISRSSAVGLLIGAHIAHRHTLTQNKTPDASLICKALVSRLRIAHPGMEPNRRILNMGCNMLEEKMGMALMGEITGRGNLL